jgi:hypothetical protein
MQDIYEKQIKYQNFARLAPVIRVKQAMMWNGEQKL